MSVLKPVITGTLRRETVFCPASCLEVSEFSRCFAARFRASPITAPGASGSRLLLQRAHFLPQRVANRHLGLRLPVEQNDDDHSCRGNLACRTLADLVERIGRRVADRAD